jgi:hypothetical protein
MDKHKLIHNSLNKANRNNEDPCCAWILRCFNVWMMQKRRRPLGERAGQSLDFPSELAQFMC